MKLCPTCQVEKDDSEFDLRRAGNDTLRHQCKECRVLYESRAPETLVGKLVEVPKVPLPRDPEQRLKMAIELRMTFYKESALEALYDLASMEIGTNSSMAQIKYLAACKLAGPINGEGGAQSGNAELDGLLAKLNDSYHQHAPRIKSIRERTVTFDQPEAIDVPPG